MFKAHKRLKRVPQTDFKHLTRRFWYTRLLLFKPKMSSYHVQERPSSHFFPSLLEIFASYTSHETTSTPFHRFQHNRAPSTHCPHCLKLASRENCVMDVALRVSQTRQKGSSARPRIDTCLGQCFVSELSAKTKQCGRPTCCGRCVLPCK